MDPESARCWASTQECFHPETALPDGETRACEPCQDYLIDTVCKPPLEAATADACAERVTSALDFEAKIFAAVLGVVAMLQAVCCLCALRVAHWSWSVESAQRDEESLLAQVSKLRHSPVSVCLSVCLSVYLSIYLCFGGPACLCLCCSASQEMARLIALFCVACIPCAPGLPEE